MVAIVCQSGSKWNPTKSVCFFSKVWCLTLGRRGERLMHSSTRIYIDVWNEILRKITLKSDYLKDKLPDIFFIFKYVQKCSWPTTVTEDYPGIFSVHLLLLVLCAIFFLRCSVRGSRHPITKPIRVLHNILTNGGLSWRRSRKALGTASRDGRIAVARLAWRPHFDRAVWPATGWGKILRNSLSNNK